MLMQKFTGQADFLPVKTIDYIFVFGSIEIIRYVENILAADRAKNVENKYYY